MALPTGRRHQGPYPDEVVNPRFTPRLVLEFSGSGAYSPRWANKIEKKKI